MRLVDERSLSLGGVASQQPPWNSRIVTCESIGNPSCADSSLHSRYVTAATTGGTASTRMRNVQRMALTDRPKVEASTSAAAPKKQMT